LIDILALARTPRRRSTMNVNGAGGGGKSWKSYGSGGRGAVGRTVEEDAAAAAGLPSSSADLIAAARPAPQAPTVPDDPAPGASMDPDLLAAARGPWAADRAQAQDRLDRHPADDLLPRDVAASNVAMTPGRQDSPTVIQQAMKSANIAAEAGADPQRQMDERLKSKMMQDYDSTMSRIAAKKAAQAAQEKTWNSPMGNFAAMWGNVANTRMAQRNQATADLNGDYQMAAELAQKIRGGTDDSYVVAGSGIGMNKRGEFKVAPVQPVTTKYVESQDGEGNPVLRAVQVSKFGGDVTTKNVDLGNGVTPVTKGSLQDDKLAAQAFQRSLDRAAKAAQEAGRLGEVSRLNDIRERAVNGKITHDQGMEEIYRGAETRKENSGDERINSKNLQVILNGLQAELKNPNTPADRLEVIRTEIERTKRKMMNPAPRPGTGGAPTAPPKKRIRL